MAENHGACPKCGRPNPTDSRFCQWCGAAFSPATNEPTGQLAVSPPAQTTLGADDEIRAFVQEMLDADPLASHTDAWAHWRSRRGASVVPGEGGRFRAIFDEEESRQAQPPSRPTDDDIREFVRRVLERRSDASFYDVIVGSFDRWGPREPGEEGRIRAIYTEESERVRRPPPSEPSSESVEPDFFNTPQLAASRGVEVPLPAPPLQEASAAAATDQPTTLRCASCGAAYSPGASRCVWCGRDISEGAPEEADATLPPPVSDDAIREFVRSALERSPVATGTDVWYAWFDARGAAPAPDERLRVRAIYDDLVAPLMPSSAASSGPAAEGQKPEAIPLTAPMPVGQGDGENQPNNSFKEESVAARRQRRRTAPALEQPKNSSKEEPMATRDTIQEDMGPGQIVIVVARWLLVATAFAITLWSPNPDDLDGVKITVIALFAVAIGNFYLHAQILMRRPLPASTVYTASAFDIGVISLVIWAFAASGGTIFVFYYTALLAISLVFPMGVTALFTVGLLAAYAAVRLGPSGVMPTDAALQVLALRLISLAAIAVVGSMYQRVERERREASSRPRGALADAAS